MWCTVARSGDSDSGEMKFFVDNVLPFGLQSDPLLFTVVGDALQWAMKKEGASWLDHYLDDFITVGDPG